MKRVEFNTNDPEVIYEMLSDKGKKTLFSQLLTDEPIIPQPIEEEHEVHIKPLAFIVIVGIVLKVLVTLL